MEKQERRIEKIKRMCKENNITLDCLIREAEIPTSTITNWNKKEPDAFEVYDRIMAALNELIEKQNAKKQ